MVGGNHFEDHSPGTHHWHLFVSPGDLKVLLESAGFEKSEFAGIKFDWQARSKSGLPVKVNFRGNTTVIYFGATRKSLEG